MSLPAGKMNIFTYGDYVKWNEGQRWELIEGTAYNMSPVPNRLHQKVAGEWFR